MTEQQNEQMDEIIQGMCELAVSYAMDGCPASALRLISHATDLSKMRRAVCIYRLVRESRDEVRAINRAGGVR